MTVLVYSVLIGLGMVVIPERIGSGTILSSNKKGLANLHKGPWDNRPGPLLLMNQDSG
jgi:hypothetical protein